MDAKLLTRQPHTVTVGFWYGATRPNSSSELQKQRTNN